MDTIKKRIVTDEDSRPVAVQIDYEGWLKIERKLQETYWAGKVENDGGRFRELLEKTRGTWKSGEGLEYQMRLRKEWEDR